MKKTKKLLLCLSLMTSLAVRGVIVNASSESWHDDVTIDMSQVGNGWYQGSAVGEQSMIKTYVSVSNGDITQVVIKSHNERYYADPLVRKAIDTIPTIVREQDNLNVEIDSKTARGIINSIKDAFVSFNGNKLWYKKSFDTSDLVPEWQKTKLKNVNDKEKLDLSIYEFGYVNKTNGQIVDKNATDAVRGIVNFKLGNKDISELILPARDQNGLLIEAIADNASYDKQRKITKLPGISNIVMEEDANYLFVGENFLTKTSGIRTIYLPRVLQVDEYFAASSTDIMNVVLPSTTIVGANFLSGNTNPKGVYLGVVEEVKEEPADEIEYVLDEEEVEEEVEKTIIVSGDEFYVSYEADSVKIDGITYHKTLDKLVLFENISEGLTLTSTKTDEGIVVGAKGVAYNNLYYKLSDEELPYLRVDTPKSSIKNIYPLTEQPIVIDANHIKVYQFDQNDKLVFSGKATKESLENISESQPNISKTISNSRTYTNEVVYDLNNIIPKELFKTNTFSYRLTNENLENSGLTFSLVENNLVVSGTAAIIEDEELEIIVEVIHEATTNDNLILADKKAVSLKVTLSSSEAAGLINGLVADYENSTSSDFRILKKDFVPADKNFKYQLSSSDNVIQPVVGIIASLNGYTNDLVFGTGIEVGENTKVHIVEVNENDEIIKYLEIRIIEE